MSATTADRPKKKSQDLRKLDWEALLDLSLRCGYDFGKKRQIHDEMLRRVAQGFIREAHCPIRLFHH